MPRDYLPPKICPLMSGPSGLGGTSLEDCTSRCALYDTRSGSCALLAIARHEPAQPVLDGFPDGGRNGGCVTDLKGKWVSGR